MKKSEMFDLILSKVCEVCEVSVDSVVNGKKLQSVVDARIMAVHFMRKTGLTNDDIALIVLRKHRKDMQYYPELKSIKAKAKGIDKEYYLYFDRKESSPAFQLMDNEIKKWCLTEFEELKRNFV